MNCAVYRVENGYKLQTPSGSLYCTSLGDAMTWAYGLGEDWAAAGPGVFEPGNTVGFNR